jgi:hypothetical protein
VGVRGGDEMFSPGLYADLQPWNHHFLPCVAATEVGKQAVRIEPNWSLEREQSSARNPKRRKTTRTILRWNGKTEIQRDKETSSDRRTEELIATVLR